MLDTFTKKEDYFQLVVDQETFGILATCSGLPIAHAISIGIPNSSVMNVQLPGCEDLRRGWYNRDLTKHLILVRSNRAMLIPSESNVAKWVEKTNSGNLFDVESFENPDPNWLEKRKLSVVRQSVFWRLEQKIERFLARSKNFIGDEIFIPFMARELENPKSLAIQEWAHIQGLDVQEARCDLEIKIKTAQLNVCKLNAIWEKYVRLINQTISEKEMTELVTTILEMELRSGVQ